MSQFHRVLSRRRTLGFVTVAALLFGLAMLHPYPRQSLFGPTIRGKPWCVWENALRGQHGELREESWSDQLRQWLGRTPPQRELISLEEMFDHPKMLPLVVACLDDPDPGVRSVCMSAIIWFPCLRDRSALPALRKWYAEDETELRLLAGTAIYRIEKDEAVLRWFVRLLDSTDPEIRASAMGHLARLSEGTPELYSHIIAHAKDTHPPVRCQVMGAMVHFGKKGVPILVSGMADGDAGVRYWAVLHAERIGPAAKDAIPALEACLRDPDPSLRAIVPSALRAIEPERFKERKAEERNLPTAAQDH